MGLIILAVLLLALAVFAWKQIPALTENIRIAKIVKKYSEETKYETAKEQAANETTRITRLEEQYPKGGNEMQYAVTGILASLSLFCILSLSFIYVGQNETAHLNRVYMASDLTSGNIIAKEGEKGKQARVIVPGFHIIPLINLLYDVEMHNVINIPEGKLGVLVAKDGAQLRAGQFIADEWQGTISEMLDAEMFLGYKGKYRGQKGTQLTVLTPGDYRYNTYLFDVTLHNAETVRTGEVGVIRSNVATSKDCGAISANTVLVPVGCVGVWDTPMKPNRYHLNPKAYTMTKIPTRLQKWDYKGGYDARRIDLTVGDNGKISQKETVTTVVYNPQTHADKAINVRVEGWTIPVELRAVIKVNPKDAPLVVATVGGLLEVENKVITPAIRDSLRTIGGRKDSACKKGSVGCSLINKSYVNKGTKVLDFVEDRDSIANEVLAAISPIAKKYGVTVEATPLGEPAIPPEMLVSKLRTQLATQLQATYEQERKAQKERIKTERARATADQQEILVKAEIEKSAAEHKKEKLRLEGEGEKLKLIEIAQGQKAQASVLGEDRVMQLQLTKMKLDAAERQPGILKVPHWLNISSGENAGSDLTTAFGILGASNLSRDQFTSEKSSSHGKK